MNYEIVTFLTGNKSNEFSVIK